METQSTVQCEGGSLIIPLPDALAERLGLHAGDTVYIIETETGIFVTPHDAETLEVMEIEARVRARYTNALRRLGQ